MADTRAWFFEPHVAVLRHLGHHLEHLADGARAHPAPHLAHRRVAGVIEDAVHLGTARLDTLAQGLAALRVAHQGLVGDHPQPAVEHLFDLLEMRADRRHDDHRIEACRLAVEQALQRAVYALRRHPVLLPAAPVGVGVAAEAAGHQLEAAVHLHGDLVHPADRRIDAAANHRHPDPACCRCLRHAPGLPRRQIWKNITVSDHPSL
jgi:hypothetical protein